MAIPEPQLVAWSHRGSVQQSGATYQVIRNVLTDRNTPFAKMEFSTFLQGSYGNETNIYRESDVDIVIRLESAFQHDLSSLPDDQKAAFHQAYSNTSYGLNEFKRDVLSVLRNEFANSVSVGSKAIKIKGDKARRDADVIVSMEYRRYHSFSGTMNEKYEKGICFYTRDNNFIVNYPKQHAANCTIKHQRTDEWFKPMVRVLKNMRSKLVDDGSIRDGLAPSYFLEGLLYNVPPEKFGDTFDGTFCNCVNWLLTADRSKFVCANEQYYLLHEDSLVTWRAADCTAFLDALCQMWRNWKI